MKERISQLMNSEGLTSSKFAEEIGIQRALMSHIINGRHNPSLDIAQKILARYSDINPDWLLFGTGNMKRSMNATGNPTKQEPDLFTNVSPPLSKPLEEKTSGYYQKAPSPDVGRKKAEAPINPAPNNPIVKEVLVSKETPVKRITRIMIFYSDNTFETFQQETGIVSF
jgi:transcriptional regulator with XRE-family HTH domain